MLSDARFTLSAFGDEIADDLAEQLRVLRELKIGYLELRGAWGKNVLHLNDDEIAQARTLCADHGISVSAIGSPIGKSPLVDPTENEVSNLQHIVEIARSLGTQMIRVFSFYPPDITTNAHYDQHLDESIEKLARLTEVAASEGVTLVLENESGIVGDTISRCHAILSAIESPHLRFAWDPANFIVVGERDVTTRGWPLLSPYVAHVHIKDYAAGEGKVKAAGEGDGQVAELLARLREANYRGFLALEPHLVTAGHSSGFSGAEGMAFAADRLRQLMAATGCTEAG
jgi:sugar phosphate isomerase/epimerase